MQEKEIGKITHYFGKVSAGIIELTDSLKAGDTIHLKGAHTDFTQVVESMQVEHESIQEAKAGDAVGIKVKDRVHPNDKVYKLTEE
ncbi:MAG: hypothetical protein JW734_04810 [Candidatus Omnitrophica bacterium]|nr:hypothetical protein [Candidatus Omnitrophota bacterium]